MFCASPLSTLIHDQAKKYGERTAMMYRDYEKNVWKNISWNEFSRRVRLASNAMLKLGVGVQENMAVFSQNMPECLITDFAAYGIRAVTIPFYATSSEMQVKYMVSDASIRYIFVGEQYQYDTALRVQQLDPRVEKLILMTKDIERDERDSTSITYDEFLAIGEGLPFNDEVNKRTSELK